MTRAYLDSSVLLRYILNEKGALGRSKLQDFSLCSSEILRLECLRTLDRARVLGRLSDEQLSKRRQILLVALASIDQVEVSRELLSLAADPFPTLLSSMDAIHLATARKIREFDPSLQTILTHDHELANAAIAIGFSIAGTE